MTYTCHFRMWVWWHDKQRALISSQLFSNSKNIPQNVVFVISSMFSTPLINLSLIWFYRFARTRYKKTFLIFKDNSFVAYYLFPKPSSQSHCKTNENSLFAVHLQNSHRSLMHFLEKEVRPILNFGVHCKECFMLQHTPPPPPPPPPCCARLTS